MIIVRLHDAGTCGLCKDRDQAGLVLASTKPSLPWSLCWQVPCQLIKGALALAGRGRWGGGQRKSVQETCRVKAYSQDTLHFIVSLPMSLCSLLWLSTHSSTICSWQGVWSFWSVSRQVLGVQSGPRCSFLPHPHQLRALSSSLLLPCAHQHSIVSLKETDFPHIDVSMAVSPVTPMPLILDFKTECPVVGHMAPGAGRLTSEAEWKPVAWRQEMPERSQGGCPFHLVAGGTLLCPGGQSPGSELWGSRREGSLWQDFQELGTRNMGDRVRCDSGIGSFIQFSFQAGVAWTLHSHDAHPAPK